MYIQHKCDGHSDLFNNAHVCAVKEKDAIQKQLQTEKKRKFVSLWECRLRVYVLHTCLCICAVTFFLFLYEMCKESDIFAYIRSSILSRIIARKRPFLSIFSLVSFFMTHTITLLRNEYLHAFFRFSSQQLRNAEKKTAQMCLCV